MAKYLAQIVIMGAQVVGRAFTRALKQEFAASQTAANQRRSNNGLDDRVINAKLGMNLNEAMQILNIDNQKLSKENTDLIIKNYNHLFEVNDKAKGGSFYLQSKKCVQNWRPLATLRNKWNAFPNYGTNLDQKLKAFVSMSQSNGLHTSDSSNVFEEALNEQNIQNCIELLKSVTIVRPLRAPFVRVGKRNAPNAAVLVPFCRNEEREPSVLFTQRSNNMSHHKGEVCFPGGIEEANDNKEMIRTAVRETIEELGVQESHIRVYGRCNPFPSFSGAIVCPVLGFIDLTDIDLKSKINREEVEKVFSVPLKRLCDESNWSCTQWKAGWTTPIFQDNRPDIPRVWGMTATILYVVLSALLPNVFKYDSKLLSLHTKRT